MTRARRLLIKLIVVAAGVTLGWQANAQADADPGSTYIYVSKQVPQRLYLIDGGRIVFQSPVNTGIPLSPTPDGVFHVFASYPSRTMKGTDPVTLKPYSDANVPYAMYFDGGRAIHGFPRHGYGYPQSFGCVELPVYKARELYGLLQGGLDTEVVVASHPPMLALARPASGGRSAEEALARSARAAAAPYPTDDRLADETLPSQ